MRALNSWSPGALRELVGVFGAAENLHSIFDREFRTSHLWRQCKTRQRRRSEYGKSSFVGIRKGQSKLGANFWTPNLPNVVDGRSPISRRFAAASLRFLQCLTSSKHSKKHSDYFVVHKIAIWLRATCTVTVSVRQAALSPASAAPRTMLAETIKSLC